MTPEGNSGVNNGEYGSRFITSGFRGSGRKMFYSAAAAAQHASLLQHRLESISEAVLHKGHPRTAGWVVACTYLRGSAAAVPLQHAAQYLPSVSACVHLIKPRRYRDNNHQFAAEYRRRSRDETSGSVL